MPTWAIILIIVVVLDIIGFVIYTMVQASKSKAAAAQAAAAAAAKAGSGNNINTSNPSVLGFIAGLGQDATNIVPYL